MHPRHHLRAFAAAALLFTTAALVQAQQAALPNVTILATGGTGLVKAAYSSGKPAYGVGPGNTPV